MPNPGRLRSIANHGLICNTDAAVSRTPVRQIDGAVSGPTQLSQSHFTDTKVVSDLVEQCDPDPAGQVLGRAGGPTDRGEEERDSVRARTRIGAPTRQWDAFVEAVKRTWRTLVINDDRHILHFRAKVVGNRRHGIGHQGFEGIDVDRLHVVHLASNRHAPPKRGRWITSTTTNGGYSTGVPQLKASSASVDPSLTRGST